MQSEKQNYLGSITEFFLKYKETSFLEPNEEV